MSDHDKQTKADMCVGAATQLVNEGTKHLSNPQYHKIASNAASNLGGHAKASATATGLALAGAAKGGAVIAAAAPVVVAAAPVVAVGAAIGGVAYGLSKLFGK